MNGISYLEYTLLKMCQRREKILQSIESVGFSIRCVFGLADNTALLPVDANAFYYIQTLNVSTIVAQATAAVYLEISKVGTAGSAGPAAIQTDLLTTAPLRTYMGIECDSLLYRVAGNTAGSVNFMGTVWQVNFVP